MPNPERTPMRVTPIEPIGHVPPAEFEQEYYRQQAGQAIAA